MLRQATGLCVRLCRQRAVHRNVQVYTRQQQILCRRTFCQATDAAITPRTCGKCGSDTKDPFFCSDCGVILPPLDGRNAFAVFSVDEDQIGSGRFGIDQSKLERRYWALQKLLHPDLFHTQPPESLKLAEKQSMLVNQAYRILTSPYERAKLILELRGYDVGEEGVTYHNPELLMEVMEVREELEESSTEMERERIGEENQQKIDATVHNVGTAFEAGDFERARECTIRLRYLMTIKNEVFDLVD